MPNLNNIIAAGLPSLALADDHVLLRMGLATMLTELKYPVLFQASDGNDCLRKLDYGQTPDILLLDINMPGMDGFQTAAAVRDKYPSIHVLALSMYNDEFAVLKMIRSGARGYLLKDCDPSELQRAIAALMSTGYYTSELVSGRLIKTLSHKISDTAAVVSLLGLTTREIEVIQHSASD
jgi:two-component system invasion response regulator UvrY